MDARAQDTPRHASLCKVQGNRESMKLSGTGQIDRLGDGSLGRNSLQDVRLQGVEGPSPAIRQARGSRGRGKRRPDCSNLRVDRSWSGEMVPGRLRRYPRGHPQALGYSALVVAADVVASILGRTTSCRWRGRLEPQFDYTVDAWSLISACSRSKPASGRVPGRWRHRS